MAGWLWPDFLRLLILIPIVPAVYIWMLRRRARFAVRYSSLSLARGAAPRFSWMRRHLPFILFTISLTSLVVSLARPLMARAVLSGRTTIILTLDISRSMCMRDIQPNRLETARAAALSFVHQPVPGTQVGIVAFSGFAELAQAPTTRPDLLEAAIADLATSTQTAIGSAILRALDAIAEVDRRVASSNEIDPSFDSSPAAPGPLKSPGRYAPHIIVLLTDGASNTGPSPLLAARQAAERGIRIFSIGFGTTRNAVMDCWNLTDGASPAKATAEPIPGSSSFGTGADEATLRQIAEMTGGAFYAATSAAELQAVFQRLHSYIAATNETIEVSALFIGLALLTAVTAFILSAAWHPVL